MQIVGPSGYFTGIECDIAPIVNCDAFVHYTSTVSGWAGGGYNSAFAWWRERVSIYEFSGVSCFMIWDSQPTMLKVNGNSELGSIQYDSTTGYYAALVGTSGGYSLVTSQPVTALETFHLHGTGSGYTVDYTPYFEYIGEQVILYNWTSVSAISGKNGILSLTEILNINDGEAVDDVGLSGNISLSASSALDALIDAVVQEDSNVTVSYSIPDETYSYIKLVYKKDYIPTSYTDGTAIDITQSSTEKIISGIADGSTYWFVIFTDISESEPVSFDTVRTSWMGEEVILLYSGNSNTMTAQISDGHILFKLYSGETVIYSFNAYAGSTVSDANKIYVQFLKDDTNEIAKPSLVYFDGTNYSINQETPTDEQMSDIYTWLSASNQSI